ncbi:hypothetical protein NMY22_g18804 [Coprinellus aureogranulatus]|nr:hypothetical protein NMY22_g18804 [Coprinellus aureogranulatus]
MSHLLICLQNLPDYLPRLQHRHPIPAGACPDHHSCKAIGNGSHLRSFTPTLIHPSRTLPPAHLLRILPQSSKPPQFWDLSPFLRFVHSDAQLHPHHPHRRPRDPVPSRPHALQLWGPLPYPPPSTLSLQPRPLELSPYPLAHRCSPPRSSSPSHVHLHPVLQVKHSNPVSAQLDLATLHSSAFPVHPDRAAEEEGEAGE